MSCWCLPERMFGRDTDDLFAYPTVRYTLVRDRRLGLLRYLFFAGIFLFIVVIQIFYFGSHLVRGNPEGTVQFTLMQPMNRCNMTMRKTPGADCGKCIYKGHETEGTHDGWYASDCYNDVADVTELPYCTQSSLNYTGGKCECSVEGFLSVQHIFESSILITTRITESWQNRTCDTLKPGITYCDRTWTNPTADESKLYVAGIEAYTIMFDHSMQASQFDIRTYSATMETRGLHMPDGHPHADEYCRRYSNDGSSAPCMVMPNRTGAAASSGSGSDYLRLDVLLAAAGVTLDDVSFSGKTYRDTGLTLVITVDYYNRKTWSLTPGSSQYAYTATMFPHTDFKLNDVFMDGTETRRVVDRHGIRIVFIHAGTLHAFEFNELLIQLTASLTLFAVANLVVDFLCTQILPYHKVYRSYKYIKTVDFSDLRDAVEDRMDTTGMAQKDVLEEFGDAVQQLHCPFTRQATAPSPEGSDDEVKVGWFTTKTVQKDAADRGIQGPSALAQSGSSEADPLVQQRSGSFGQSPSVPHRRPPRADHPPHQPEP
eukprot:TRINITY_DN36077_c0_g1_i1.p1 TRINITY_DN36077_c0_g1~~TRINITY_DN36077_c0_g1_i1.p1  ORF type:complete len:542 (+),score=120.32 TRINITY_DN36077_c0_g1_i1:77-1702(+)